MVSECAFIVGLDSTTWMFVCLFMEKERKDFICMYVSVCMYQYVCMCTYDVYIHTDRQIDRPPLQSFGLLGRGSLGGTGAEQSRGEQRR